MTQLPAPTRLPTTRTFLDRLARKIADWDSLPRPVSDYRIAQVLGVTNATTSHWRRQRSSMGDEIALKVAAILGEDERYVLACLQVERNRRNAPVREAWMRIATPGILVPALFLFLLLLSPQATRADAFGVVNTIHYAQRRRRFPRFLPVPVQ